MRSGVEWQYAISEDDKFLDSGLQCACFFGIHLCLLLCSMLVGGE